MNESDIKKCELCGKDVDCKKAPFMLLIYYEEREVFECVYFDKRMCLMIWLGKKGTEN